MSVFHYGIQNLPYLGFSSSCDCRKMNISQLAISVRQALLCCLMFYQVFRNLNNLNGITMNKFPIAGLFYLLMTSLVFVGNVWAENPGVENSGADVAGTVHTGLKLSKSNVASSRVGLGIYAGYTIYGPGAFTMQYLDKTSIAAEIEFTDLGSFRNASADFTGTVASLSGVATYPISEKFAFVSKVGFARTKRKYDCGWSTCADVSSSNRYGLHLGVAGQYKLTRLMSFRGGYDLYPDGASAISVNAVYRFSPQILREKPSKPKMEGVLRIEGIEPMEVFPF